MRLQDRKELLSEVDAQQPLRVALVLYRDDPATGGSLRVGEALANSLAKTGVDAELVFAYGRGGPVAERVTIPVHYLDARGSRDLRGWFSARRLVRQLKPDILHFVDPVLWVMLATVGTQPVRILHRHGGIFPKSETRSGIAAWRAQTKLSEAQVYITAAARDSVVQQGFGTSARAYVVRNAIEVERFNRMPSRAQAREYFGITPEAKLLGMLCRLTPYKGLVDAINLVPHLGPEWQLAIFGRGPFQPQLERQAEQLGITDRVRFMGVVSDARTAYAAMDAYLFMTQHEPFGLVLAEAMAAGVPIFGLAGEGGYAEPEYPLVTDSNAALVPRSRPHDYDLPEDATVLQNLAERIAAFGSDPEICRPMVDRARRWVRKRFDAHIQAEKMAAVYSEVAKGRRSA